MCQCGVSVPRFFLKDLVLSWYEHFQNTAQMDGAIVGIDHGVQLAQLQVVNLNDFFEIILDHYNNKSPGCQIPVFGKCFWKDSCKWFFFCVKVLKSKRSLWA